MHNAQFKSLAIEFLLYHFGILDFQYTGNFLSSWLTSVVTIPFSWIIFVFIRIYFNSVFDFWMVAIECKEIVWLVLISFIYNIIKESRVKLCFGRFNYFSLCLSHVNIEKYYRKWVVFPSNIHIRICKVFNRS